MAHDAHDTSDSQDRRVRRTQRLLAEALIALSLEKRYDAVTIRDITERADVGYTTFFRHYPDKDALLYDVLEVELDDLIARLSPLPDGDPIELGTMLFRSVQEQSEICRVLLGSHGSAQLVERVIAAGTEQVLALHRAAPNAQVPPEIVAHHLVTATIALIQWWLEHDMPYPPERMAAFYRDMIIAPDIPLAFRTQRDSGE